MSTWTMCVSCGAALETPSYATRMRVCRECRTLMERYGEEVLDRGFCPDLLATNSLLGVGKRGSYKGKPFQLMGRAQLKQDAGSVWDEWYAAFEDSPWGWLAEAQGRLYLTFEQKVDNAETELPGFDELEVGSKILLPGVKDPLTVSEINVAEIRSAEGELPWAYKPEEKYRFVDLTGPKGIFATIDYRREKPVLFVGEEISYADFEDAETKPTRESEILSLPCPNCKHELQIHVPRRTVRVGCPHCSTLLNFRDETLNEAGIAFTKKTQSKKGKSRRQHHKPRLEIPIGSVGKLKAGEMTVVGYLQKGTTYQGRNYYWDEYLLHSPELGYRWLVQSDHHWSFVNEIPGGEVNGLHAFANYHGHSFSRFQGGKATVKSIVGEIYWMVEPGEDTQTADYVKPPFMLSKETTKSGQKKTEEHWSLGQYVTVEEVENAFGVRNLPRPTTIGANQPFPHRGIYKYWLLFTCTAIVLWVTFTIIAKNRSAHQQSFTLPATTAFLNVTSKPFRLRRDENVVVGARGGTEQTWTLINGAFMNRETGRTYPFGIALGSQDREGTEHLSALPAGEYVLNLEITCNSSAKATTVHLTVKQDVPDHSLGGWLILFLAILPVCVGLYHLRFISRRWENSGG